MERTSMDIVIYGAGAIGSTVAGWLAPHHEGLSLLARGEHARKIRKDGLVIRIKGDTGPVMPIYVPVIKSLAERRSAEVIVIAVKNYDLEGAARDIKKKIRGEPLVVALQNGIENQKVLPRYFSRVVYGVVCYNAWRDAPGTVGAGKKGTILFGVPGNDGERAADVREVVEIFGRGMNAVAARNFQDAAHSKLLMNLTNSLLTLVGHKIREIEDIRALKKITLGALLEGMEILTRAGYREEPIPEAPPWRLLKIAAKLPDFLSDIIFANDFKNIGINSMGQDVFRYHKRHTEIESLNGYFISMADSLGLKAPVNRTLYAMGRELLPKPGFRPMSETELWKAVRKNMG